VSARVLKYTVVVRRPEDLTAVALVGGQPVPDWATDLVHPDDLVDADVAADCPPPQSGKGSGVDAWRDYASGKVDVADGASREEIIEALTAAGVPVE
jgi:hypothetical protein